MYQASKALFLYCVSPVHMGAGTAIGLIDNPIQRERHTDYPLFAGSGLKGAMRYRFHSSGWDKDRIERIFGPETSASDFAGALSVGDAQLVAFPVRCTSRAYVYATSRTALARTKRQLDHLGAGIDVPWAVPEVQDGCCGTVPGSPLGTDGGVVNLELFQFTAREVADLAVIANWLADHALPQDAPYKFFRDKLRTDLVLLPDADFVHYVRNATVVEPHVRINDETGTADEGGLFYTENLPPESLLLAPLMASRERSSEKKRNGSEAMAADAVLDWILKGRDGKPGLDGMLLQVGGDATTGRGQTVVKAV
ncbi:MAG: type III-B CRISPR module RAMP protein Cmr4 [Gammaproteobacteria bacterium]|nr:type III-B CRISPR module RAMP protein Cmr4 [Gammaproteobacteria bacterium]